MATNQTLEIIANLFLSICGYSILRTASLSRTTMALIAFPVGALLYVWMGTIFIICFGYFSTAVVGSILAILSIFRAIQQRTPLLEFAPLIIGISICTGLLVQLGISVTSFDSYDIIFLSWALVQTDTLTPLAGKLAGYPVFLPIIHASAFSLGLDYFVSFSPLIGISGFAAALALVNSTLRGQVKISRYVIACTIGTAFLFSSYFFTHQQFYVNGHCAVASYLSLSFLLASIQNDRKPEYLLSGLFLGAIPLLRLEGMLLAALIWIACFSDKQVSSWKKSWPLGIALLVFAPWYLNLALIGSSGTIGSPSKYLLMLSILIGLFVLPFIPFVKRYLFLAPKACLLGLSLALLLAAALKPQHISEAVAAFGSNLAVTGTWLSFWISGIIALLAALQLPKIPEERRFWQLLVSFLMLVIALIIMRDNPYRIGWGDSGNRMMSHIAPLFVLYFILKLSGVKDTSSSTK